MSNYLTIKNGHWYLQHEIVEALDFADEPPEGATYIIPVKLEECEVPPRLRRWQRAALYGEDGYLRLRRALELRAAAEMNLNLKRNSALAFV